MKKTFFLEIQFILFWRKKPGYLSTETWPRPGLLCNRGFIPVVIKRLRLLQNTHNGDEGQTASNSMHSGGGFTGLFPFVDGVWVVKLRGHLYISEIRNEGSYAYIPPYSFKLSRGTTVHYI
jgi:hypothetical protein